MKLLEKILAKLIKLFAIIERLDIVGKIIIIGLLIFSIYFLRNCSGSDIDQLKLEVQQTKEQAKILKDSATKLINEVNEKDVIITKLSFEISLKQTARASLVSRQRNLEDRRKIETDTTVILSLQDSTIDNLKGQVALADTVIAGKDVIITESGKQVDLLRAAIEAENKRASLLESQLDKAMNQVNKETKIFGFIPKPTRKAAFITGLTAGVITGIVIAK